MKDAVKILVGAAIAGGTGLAIWYLFFRPPPAPPPEEFQVEATLTWD